MRLNVYLQKSGIGSRREAERWIAEGLITINGKVATVTDPVEDGDEVKVNGKLVTLETKPLPRLFLLHKPVDVLTTTYDSEGRKTVYDLPALNPPLWKKSWPRVMYVGRLDVNSEGLLMFSSDGALAQKMMSPDTELKRVYRVRVRGRLKEGALKKLAAGVTVKGVKYKGADITEEREPAGANTWYRVIITEGKNREIRKLMERFGCIVNRLIRISYGPFELGDLPIGKIMEIPSTDVAHFMQELEKRGVEN
jgi:23S rRNA pseudouridine2605 synthase